LATDPYNGDDQNEQNWNEKQDPSVGRRGLRNWSYRSYHFQLFDLCQGRDSEQLSALGTVFLRACL
ncbi:MAG: hypothetical protein MK103_15075, partial [Planctomycetes bacterium]|nr:hypothetical protein [Planctomycetota bacterium]